MRSLLVLSAAWVGFVAAPAFAQTTQPPATGSGPASTLEAGQSAIVAQNTVVAQATPSTVLPPVSVTAPAPRINDPWDISTWRFHAGPNPYAPANGAWGLSGGFPHTPP